MTLPLVHLPIIARNAAPFLPLFMECLARQTYPHDRIILSFHTGDNQDNTDEAFAFALMEHTKFTKVEIFRKYFGLTNRRHDWAPENYRAIAAIRHVALRSTIDFGADYTFFIDCDQFMVPETLSDLIACAEYYEKEAIWAPLTIGLTHKVFPAISDIKGKSPRPPTMYGWMNASVHLDNEGRGFQHPRYHSPLAFGQCTRVAIVTAPYMIPTPLIDRLTFIDETDRPEDVILCHSARKAGIEMILQAERQYGIDIKEPSEIEAARAWLSSQG